MRAAGWHFAPAGSTRPTRDSLLGAAMAGPGALSRELREARDQLGATRAAALLRAAEAAGATVIGEHAQRYVPHGVTFVLFLAESHIMLTTWPEYRLVMADILLCNAEMSEDAAIDEIARRICPDGVVERSYVTRHIESLGTV